MDVTSPVLRFSVPARPGRARAARLVTAAVGVLLASSTLAGAQGTTAAPPTAAGAPDPCTGFAPTMACASGTCRIDVVLQPGAACSLRIDDAFIGRQPSATRISEKTIVRVRVVRPNLLRYALHVETRETEIESYVYLEKLWKQILGFGLLPTPPAALSETPDDRQRRDQEQRFVDAINVWRDALAGEDESLTDFIGQFTAVTLGESAQQQITTRSEQSAGRVQMLEARRLAAKNAMSRAEHFAVYDATAVTHAAVADRLASFDVLAGLIASGFDTRVTFGAAGRVVAVTITVKDKATGRERAESVGIEFFVHSTLPVTFHAGYVVRALEEQSFQTVASSLATAGGADLFARVQDSEVNGTFTAFLSYRLCDATRRGRGCPHLTIGTDFKDVGQRLYGGMSWPIGRAFITAGVVNGETKEGEGAVSDALGALGTLTGARELFTAIDTKRKWGGFIGVSFAPF